MNNNDDSQHNSYYGSYSLPLNNGHKNDGNSLGRRDDISDGKGNQIKIDRSNNGYGGSNEK